MSRLDTPEAVRAYAAQVARHRGWSVNPDAGLTGPIVAGMAAQARRLGRPYCPCRDVDGTDADRDVVCPCAYAAQDIGEYGQCFCGLFLEPGRDPAGVGSIPERRPDPAPR